MRGAPMGPAANARRPFVRAEHRGAWLFARFSAQKPMAIASLSDLRIAVCAAVQMHFLRCVVIVLTPARADLNRENNVRASRPAGQAGACRIGCIRLKRA